MGFEVFLESFGSTARLGIPRAAVRALFPIVEEESEPDYWRVRYDDRNSCHISVKPVTLDNEKLKSLCVERPCGDMRLWKSLLTVLRMGSIFIFWPGGPLVLANDSKAAELPEDLIEGMGRPIVADSAEALLRLVQES